MFKKVFLSENQPAVFSVAEIIYKYIFNWLEEGVYFSCIFFGYDCYNYQTELSGFGSFSREYALEYAYIRMLFPANQIWSCPDNFL